MKNEAKSRVRLGVASIRNDKVAGIRIDADSSIRCTRNLVIGVLESVVTELLTLSALAAAASLPLSAYAKESARLAADVGYARREFLGSSTAG